VQFEVAVPTVRDVAQMAGVSVTTVSRVLRGERYVRPQIRAAVQSAIVELDYRPSELARQFRAQRSALVGYVVPDISEPFYAAILRGINKQLRPQGFVVAIHDTDERAAAEAEAVSALLDSRAAGMIVASSGPWPRALSERFRATEVPIVAIDNRLESADTDAVYEDNEAGAATLTRHLVEHGHQRVAFVGGIMTESSGAERLAGYRRGLAEAGVPEDERLVAVGDWRQESGRLYTLRLLRQPDQPTAILAANYVVALGVMKALRALRLRIPDDVALVAFDDFEVAELLNPPLTALRSNVESIGELAAGLLIEQLYPSGDRARRELRIPFQLVSRRSCGCPEAPVV
jgi:LacI family transcriptional regulator